MTSTSRRPARSVLLGLVLAAATVLAQEDPARIVDEQIGRIFDANEYTVPRFGPARWRPDGISYAVVERGASADAGSDIVRYDAASGAREVLVAGARMVVPGQSTPLAIDDYAWSTDGTRLLIFTNTEESVAPEYARRLLGR